jgi:hypothetical protein
MNGGILFLDVATQMGWCEGLPGEMPISGTVRLAPEGSKPAAIFGGMLSFLGARLTAFRYRMIAYEAPMDPRHMKTNINTARVLLGLPAVLEAVAYQTGHHAIREASVHDVRRHLLGARPAKGDAKRAVIEAVRGMGFDPKDDNEADSIAGWLYTVSQIDPKAAAAVGPLFRAK